GLDPPLPALPGVPRARGRRARRRALRPGVHARPVAQRHRPDRVVARAHVQANLVERDALAGYQQANDVLMAHRTLKRAFTTDVEPILGMARLRAGGAIDPLAVFRASGYRARKAAERPVVAASRSGIV